MRDSSFTNFLWLWHSIVGLVVIVLLNWMFMCKWIEIVQKSGLWMNYNVKRIITWENSKATGKAIVSNGMGLCATLGSLGCIQFYLIHIALSKIMFVVATLNLAHVHVLSIFLLKIRIYVGQAP